MIAIGKPIDTLELIATEIWANELDCYFLDGSVFGYVFVYLVGIM